jgi:ABC-2 type transport system permease protein
VSYLPFVVLAVVALAVVVRRWRGGWRRSTGPRGRPTEGVKRRVRLPFGEIGLVAAREVKERLRGRIFKGVTVILLVVVAAAVVIPTIHFGSTSGTKIGVVGALSAPLDREVLEAAARTGARAQLVQEPSLGSARAALRSGRVDLVIIDGRALLTKTPLGSTSSTGLAQASRSIASTLGVARAFDAAHLSPSQASMLAHAKPAPITSLAPPAKNGAARSTSVIGLILVFVMLTQYNTWILMGVMEEKSSRVVEVLLATVRPLQLLSGKVLGIGLLAVLQAGLLVTTALVVAAAVGSDLLKGTAPVVVVASLIWLVLGYAFYCWTYAAAGSTAERQDQVQSLALPLSVPIIVGYIVALTAASSDHPSLLVQVLAYLPPTAPFAMPVLVATGAATWWGFLLSVLISIVCTVGVARLAAGIYRRAVLRTGRRVTIRELLASVR